MLLGVLIERAEFITILMKKVRELICEGSALLMMGVGRDLLSEHKLLISQAYGVIIMLQGLERVSIIFLYRVLMI
jgi:hypothetical protein